jgi:cytochrome c biogenesis protein CcdA
MLIAIGLWIFLELFRSRAHLHFHDHDDLPRHAHWHAHREHPSRHDTDAHQHPHAAVLVGVLHGTAGSAPLLALVPLAGLGNSPWLGMAYLALFSFGVLLAMVFFGGLLGGTFAWISRWGTQALRLTRAGVAISAIAFGLHLLLNGIPLEALT